MLFSSLAFLFAFLPLTWIAWRLCRDIHSGAVIALLIIASLIFYAGDRPENLLLFLVASFATVVSLKGAEREMAPLLSLSVGVVGLLALLGYFKYAGFFSGVLASLAPNSFTALSVGLPIGISFYVLQGISCLVDRRRGQFQSAAAPQIVLYLAFFPQLIAGPIMRFGELQPQFEVAVMRRQTALARGLFLIGIGLSCKVLIADKLAPYVDMVYGAPGEASMLAAWCATWSYALQIYFDFSGYAIIAVGLGALFGINLPFNFLSPYKAVSVIDFWRRWNVTLSSFLRDYVYRPLGGARKGHPRQIVNLLATMLISGLWHGAGWTFVLWGGLHGLLLIVAHLWRWSGLAVIPRLISQPLTLILVVLLWIPFRANSVDDAALIARAMVGNAPTHASLVAPGIATTTLIVSSTLIVLLCPNAATLADRFRPSTVWLVTAGFLLGAGLLAQLYAGQVYDFIYFRF